MYQVLQKHFIYMLSYLIHIIIYLIIYFMDETESSRGWENYKSHTVTKQYVSKQASY